MKSGVWTEVGACIFGYGEVKEGCPCTRIEPNEFVVKNLGWCVLGYGLGLLIPKFETLRPKNPCSITAASDENITYH
ncbi:hypothetical protein V3F56_13995, partial [Moorellaceae bacterium AZ2]